MKNKNLFPVTAADRAVEAKASVSSKQVGKRRRNRLLALEPRYLFDGVALTERHQYGFGQLPDRIVLFQGPLTRMCHDEDELYDEIWITLVHELGHYHGIEEDKLHELGWG